MHHHEARWLGLVVLQITVMINDQHFAVLKRQHVLFLGAVALHRVDAVRKFLGRRRRLILGPNRDYASELQQNGKKGCATAHDTTPFRKGIAPSLTDIDT